MQLALTMLTMFTRPAFLTLTVCATGLYMTNCPQYIKFRQFRGLLFVTVLSWAYDVFWLLLVNSKSDEDAADGGVEGRVRAFCLLFAYISLAFKLVTFGVIWKCSINFRQVVKGANYAQSDTASDAADVEGQGPSDLDNLDRIMASYD